MKTESRMVISGAGGEKDRTLFNKIELQFGEIRKALGVLGDDSCTTV